MRWEFSQECIDAGKADFKAGKKLSDNPFHRTPVRMGGPAKAAWWEKGWKEAQAENSEKGGAA